MKTKGPHLSNRKPRLSERKSGLRVAPKKADAVFSDPRYKPWANAVKTRAGYRCEDCGKQGGRGTDVTLYADHIVERRDGGQPFDLSNGRCRCAGCHARKTARERARRLGLEP